MNYIFRMNAKLSKKTISKFNKKVYILWYNMIRRCYNKSNKDYKYYGAKGVRVCPRWLNFDYFKNDIEVIDGFNFDLFLNGYLHLDKDKNGNSKIYDLQNCTFISKSENNKYKPNQQRKILAISPSGKKIIFSNQSEFAQKYNLRQSTISDCLSGRVKKHHGWVFKYK